jgi:hypothetical protein
MAEIVETDLPETPKRPLRFDWIFPVLFKPGRAMREIAQEENGAWLLPLLLLSLLVVAGVLVSGPLRVQYLLSQPPQLPPDFQYYAPEQQQKFLEAAVPNTGATVIYLLPALGALAGVWVSWFLLGAILHLGVTMSGGRGSLGRDLNLTAWGSLPFAVRSIVQSGYMLIANQLIARTGLSGFIPSDATGALAFAGAVLALFDVYLVWQIILLTIGSSAGAGISKSKAFWAVLAAVVVLLALQALPAFIGAQFRDFNVTRMF